MLHQARADYEAEHGLDPQDSLNTSIAAFDAALANNPNDASALNNLGLAIHTRGYFRLSHGEAEGEADLDRARQTYERVLALGPDSIVLNNLGYIDVDRAEYLARIGRDPKPTVDEGVAYEQRALAANPNERFAYFNTAGMQLTQAQYEVEHRTDPDATLAAAHSAIDADLARSKAPDPDIIAYESEAHVLAARWALANKQSPADELAAAEKSLARAEKLDATTGFVVGARFELERWRAEALIAAGHDPGNAITHARMAVAKLSASDHGSSAVHMWLGELAVVEARGLRTAKTPDARVPHDAAVQTARKELATALAGNRFYEHRVNTLLADL